MILIRFFCAWALKTDCIHGRHRIAEPYSINFSDIVFKADQIALNPVAFGKSEMPVFNSLKHFSTGKLIYGINTGFGPMAQYKISDENRIQLQYNLIRSHSSGMGNPMSPLLGRQSLWPAEQPDAGAFRYPYQPG